MSTITVSIIIPVYNTEDYVSEAVNSILQQTLSSLEVIIVNDGSTDSSSEIVEDIAKHDSRVRVIHQLNQGQGAARNLGLENARGKYIYFMDSDDLLAEDALEICLARAERDDLDLVFFDAETFGDVKAEDNSHNYKRKSVKENEIYRGLELTDHLLAHNDFRVIPCLYMVRRAFLNEQNLRFDQEIVHEDELFSSLLFVKAGRVGYIKRQFFKRRLRENSVMTSSFGMANFKSYQKMAQHLKSEADQGSISKNIAFKLNYRIISSAAYKARTLRLSERLIVFSTCVFQFPKQTEKKILGLVLMPYLARSKS